MLLLRNGSVIDGTGAPAYAADVLIERDRIAAIGRLEAPDAEAIDCTGLTVAPGFIDAHSHSDLQAIEGRREKAVQGVTTEVVGNCGFSAYPASPDRRMLHDFANGIFCGNDTWGWSSAADYLEAARRASVNVVSLVGHGSLRIASAGNRHGAVEPRELDAMEQLLSESLTGGAAGFSTGLMYAPGESAPPEELERLVRVVARHGKTYATHMRDYSRRLVEAVEEQIGLARRTGCRLQISHFQAAGQKNWPVQAPALEAVERARAEGVDVAFDCYPYVCGSTVLTQVLPQWALDGGTQCLLARLSDTQERARVRDATIAGLNHQWSDFSIAAAGADPRNPLVGMTIAEIAASRGRDPVETAFDLLLEFDGAVNILERNQSDANLRQALTHPVSLVISDGFYVKGRPHPRLHGTFPLLLGTYARERGWLTLPEAVRKITSAPAERFGIAQRGKLAPGFYADVTVFDAARIGSPATYENPEQPPVGIAHVFRNGLPAAL